VPAEYAGTGICLGRLAGVVFVADDFVAWLVETLADAGRKKLAELVLGTWAWQLGRSHLIPRL
jgi:hypothetical protein